MKIIFCNLCNPPASSQASCKLVILLKPSTLPKTSGCSIFFSAPIFWWKLSSQIFAKKKSFSSLIFFSVKWKLLTFFLSYLSASRKMKTYWCLSETFSLSKKFLIIFNKILKFHAMEFFPFQKCLHNHFHIDVL